MPNTPLTIENFEFDKLRAKTFESKKSGEFAYFAIPFDYDGEDHLIKIEGNFRVFKHVNAGRVNYSLAISENKSKTAKLKSRMVSMRMYMPEFTQTVLEG